MVGDGKTIRPYTDVGIPGYYGTRIGSHLVTEIQANTALEEWIDPTARAWNEAKVRATVTDVEAQRIHRVPIPVQSKPDKMR